MALADISIISVPVSDSGRAKAFYCEVLGFKIVRDNPMGPDRQWVELSATGQAPTITLVTWFESMKPGSQQGLVIISDDIDADRQRLYDAGLAISEIDNQPFGRFATFKDPDGNGWVVQGPPLE